MDVVFHVPSGDPTVHGNALGNVENLLADDTIRVQNIAVVVNGDGLEMVVRSTDYADRVRDLVDRQVRVRACQNTLDSADRDSDALVDGVEIVPSAMGELARLQSDGYAYIRP